ncbi:CACNA2D3 [Mytilus coruscus]|uniref:CACNA2D3 n=1 Tax=Mytilus coruscus TaxID=42192 RepID=A0A6J8A5R2_MYTCO|nr:CACNA2D3 [Mytilus coruscus]
MANPSDLSTVYTTLKLLKSTANLLGQDCIPVFFYMGLVTKALEITWARPDELKGVIPCEDGMHLLMSVFSGIGYLYDDAGLWQMLCESGVFAAGTVNSMLSGKDFDRAMRGLKLVDRALHARLFYHFFLWYRRSQQQIPSDLQLIIQQFETAVLESTDVDHFLSLLQTDIEDKLQPLVDRYKAIFPSFKFLDDFLTKVLQPIKILISSTRNGIWKIFQAMKVELFQRMFLNISVMVSLQQS